MQHKDTRLFKARTVASVLNVHVSTVHRLIERGELQGVRASKGSVRIPKASLDAYLERIGIVPASAGEVA